MANTTPVNGWTYQELGDATNIETAVKTPLLLVDQRVNPIFASVGARNSAIPSPTEGQESYVTATGEKYIYNGTAWISAKPRIRRKATDSTTVIGTLQSDGDILWSVEANSVYFVTVYMFMSSTSASSDLRLNWSLPASATYRMGGWGAEGGVADPATNGTGFWGKVQSDSSDLSFGVTATASRANVILLETEIVTLGTAGTAALQWAELVATGTLSFRTGSRGYCWKVA